MYELTHASFFSGAGGVDLGLERAGWRTVSFSEIDPYACAVLAQRWPGVPNLGSITDLVQLDSERAGNARQHLPRVDSREWHRAELWTGGFPCQDLSVAGKRRGMGAGTRSGLAFAFLDLVERHRPPAVLLENVPGLLSSNAGRDFGTLLATLGQLGYGWAYRVLDARYFGVPQRRRRVFILGLHARVDPSGEGAAEVLSVGTRCPGHPATGHQAGAGAAERADVRAVGTLSAEMASGVHNGQDDHAGFLQVVRPSPDAGRDGATDGLAGRPHDRDGVAATLNSGGNSGGFRTEPGEHLVVSYRKATKAHSSDDWERWEPADETDPLTANGLTARTATAVVGTGSADDPLLPLGLDSHRYRCCGNGVVSGVAEWVGQRLAERLALEAAA